MLVYQGIYYQAKAQLQQVKAQLEQTRILETALYFNIFWNRNLLSNEPKFNGFYSRDSLPKIKDGANVINLDEFKPIGYHWIGLYVIGNNAIYFNSYGDEHIPRKVKCS